MNQAHKKKTDDCYTTISIDIHRVSHNIMRFIIIILRVTLSICRHDFFATFARISSIPRLVASQNSKLISPPFFPPLSLSLFFFLSSLALSSLPQAGR